MYKRFCSVSILYGLLTLAVIAYASAPAPPPPNSVTDLECPTITVECPPGVPEAGHTYIVSVSVEGGNGQEHLTFEWSVSSGEIVEGQGTPSIKLHITNTYEGQTATVKVGRLEGKCKNIESCSFQVARSGEGQEIGEAESNNSFNASGFSMDVIREVECFSQFFPPR